MTKRPLVIVMVAVAVSLLTAACTDDPSAQYFPTRPPAPTHSPSIDTSTAADLTSGLLAARLLHGAVARPNLKLTPGAVAITDLSAVCHGGKRIPGQFMPVNPMISAGNSQAVFAEYGISSANTRHYGLDFLIPLQLGGANVRANLWPASTSHGVGFHEKEVLNIRIHELVCQGAMPLTVAQKQITTDWVKLWLDFG